MSVAFRAYRSPSYLNRVLHPKLISTPRFTTSTPKPSNPTITFARMASTLSSKEWIVYIPDFPGALDKRLAVRPQHLSGVMPKVESGQVPFGGATLSKHPAEGEAPDMTGSFMLIKAETEAEVREALESDPYTKGGAWDTKNAQIWPFRTAVRTAL